MAKTLLVIGNGFDKAIGADTSYSDFFESEFYASTKKSVTNWISICNAEMAGYAAMVDEDNSRTNFTCWDLLFCLESNIQGRTNAEEIKWCDIEKVIHDSLINPPNGKKFSWKHVYTIMHGVYNSRGRQIPVMSQFRASNEYPVCHLLYHCGWEDQCRSYAVFCNALLDELKRFELSFGKYIKAETSSDEFNKDARKKASQLIALNSKSVQIDSFNYSDFANLNYTIRHINGTCDAPIFGIDLSVEEKKQFEELEKFTKTSRRIHQDVYDLNTSVKTGIGDIDSAVVFGHSLNAMDYDYFNYLFTILKFNTFDVSKMGSIEFVYSIYDTEKADKIRKESADSICAILNYYEEYVSPSNQSQRILINLLRFSGKLKIRELC